MNVLQITKEIVFYHDERAVDQTLERLGTDYVDLMLLHQLAGDFISGYRILEKGVKEGKILAIGVSNFNQSQIRKIMDSCEILPDVIQVECHPYYPQDDLRKFLDEIAELNRHVPFVTHKEEDMDRYLHWELNIDGQK